MGVNEPWTIQRLESLPPSFLLKAEEVAAVFRVDPKTVSRWGAAEKLPTLRTAGGHRRYRVKDVLAMLEENGEHPDASAGS